MEYTCKTGACSGFIPFDESHRCPKLSEKERVIEKLEALIVQATEEREKSKELLSACEVVNNYLTGGKEWTYSEYEYVRDIFAAALLKFNSGKGG